jgi:hypothetical protein
VGRFVRRKEGNKEIGRRGGLGGCGQALRVDQLVCALFFNPRRFEFLQKIRCKSILPVADLQHTHAIPTKQNCLNLLIR